MADIPSSMPPAKKRRGQVSLACDGCRQRKEKCNAMKPSCASCLQRGTTCSYAVDIQEGESRHQAQLREAEAGKSRLDAVKRSFRWLRELPTPQSMSILQDVLQSQDDPVATLVSMAGSRRIVPALSSGAATVLPYKRVTFAHELNNLHPNSFPFLVPVEQWAVYSETFKPPQRLEPTYTLAPIGEKRTLPPIANLMPQALEPTQTETTTRARDHARSSATQSPFPRTYPAAPVNPQALWDSRLENLSISTWTGVAIPDAAAANIISRYLAIDHPILGFFDSDLFLDDLVQGRTEFCSPLLVSTVLYWGCQMYATEDPESHSWSFKFLAEAKRRWAGDRDQRSILAIASGYILSLGLKCYCNDNLSESFMEQSTRMAMELRLFGFDKSAVEIESDENMPSRAYKAKAHVAWGGYSWLALMAHYYGTAVPLLGPSFRIPGELNEDRAEYDTLASQPPYVRRTFTALCQLRRIHTKAIFAYNTKEPTPLPNLTSLQFAEDIYKEMLQWCDELGESELRGQYAANHVLLLHILYHSMVLQLFRPFLGRQLRLRSFTADDSMPETVIEASLDQLKALAVTYHRSQPSAAYTILWHIALINIGSSVLSNAGHPDWHFFFLLCINAYQDLSKCFRVAAGFMQGLLWLATRSGLVSPQESIGFLEQFFENGPEGFRSLRSAHIVDLDLAARDTDAAENVTVAIEKLEALAIGRNARDPVPAQ